MDVTDLAQIIDAMLPADAELGMPSASEIGFDIYIRKLGLEEVALEFIRLVNAASLEKFATQFNTLTQQDKIRAIMACSLKNVRVFSPMVTHLFRAYYTAPDVLVKIGAGSAPPFPDGNTLEVDDWSFLESVYERGQIYREC